MIVGEFSLSHLQLGMLYNHLTSEASGVDLQQIVIDYKEPMDIALLHQAWRLAVERHPALRTSIQWQQTSTPVQQVHNQVELCMDIQVGEQSPTELENFLSSDCTRGFDLARAPLMRLTLFDRGQHRFRLVWSVHHIIIDGRAFVVVLDDVQKYYQRLKAGECVQAEPGPDFGPFIERLPGVDAAAAHRFWANQFSGLSGPTPLLEDNQAARSSSPAYQLEELQLSEQVTSALRKVAEQWQVTLNTIVMGVWGLVLSRYSGEQDVLFGATKTSRNSLHSKVDGVVGLFLNTVPVRADFSPEASFVSVLQRLRSTWLNLRAYEHTPLIQIREAAGFPPGAPLVESLVIFEKLSLRASLAAIDDCWKTRNVRVYGHTPYPLRLGAFGDSNLSLHLGFDGRRFTRATAQRILGHARQLFESVAVNPLQKIAEMNLLTPAERQQILVEWNDTAAPFSHDKCIHELFEAQVKKSPDAVAVFSDSESLTYAELNRRSNQLAHYLRELGVRPEMSVAICIERSPEMIVALLAVLKAGGAYVPLDPAYPAERLRFMIEDSQPIALLTQGHLRGIFPVVNDRLAVLDLMAPNSPWQSQPDTNPDANTVGLTPASLAYIIYTSGSTGKPKGVLEQHQGLCNLIEWFIKEVPLTGRDVILLASSISFDLTYKNIYGPLLAGSRIWLTPNQFDPQAILSAISRANATLLNVPPTAFYTLIEADATRQLSKLRTIVMGGEQIHLHKIALLAEPRPQILNTYGPTEITGSASFHRLRPDLDYPGKQTPPIGRPLANVSIYILDDQMQPVPVGVTGEIYIGGIGVARGYLNRPDLTAERFLIDPFSPVRSARMYRTGDLGRWLPDGAIDFLGRNDFQVKIRGMRIELGEVEARLVEHPAVREAAVIAREDTPGDKRLVGYCLAAPTGGGEVQPLVPEQLRSFMAKSLPDFMVPVAYVLLESWPSTPSGKLDRKALPPPDRDAYSTSSGYEPPEGKTEVELAAIWADLLKVDQVGRHDNFFAVGGHSLSAMQVVARLRSALDIEVPVSCLFQNPTLQSFTEAIQGLTASLQSDEELLQLLEELEAMPESSTEGAL